MSEDLRASLAAGLASAADALNLGPLQVEVSGDKILVKKRDNSLLFQVDITRFGSVLESEIEEHAVEIDEGKVAKVKPLRAISSCSRRLNVSCCERS
jgi:hypothetical protein